MFRLNRYLALLLFGLLSSHGLQAQAVQTGSLTGQGHRAAGGLRVHYSEAAGPEALGLAADPVLRSPRSREEGALPPAAGAKDSGNWSVTARPPSGTFSQSKRYRPS